MLVAARKLALIATLIAIPEVSLIAGTSERVVQNRHSGLAIDGIDPVSYFTDDAAVQGRPEFEMSTAGAFWRFRNAGNLSMFLARPDVYAPQFGGYDPVDIARGVPGRGNPQFWLIFGQRLYLFARKDNRDAFAADAAGAVSAAQAGWPTVRATLAE